MANSMLGEVTPAMAEAVSSSKAMKVIIPVLRCNTYISLSGSGTLNDHISDAARKIIACIDENNVN